MPRPRRGTPPPERAPQPCGHGNPTCGRLDTHLYPCGHRCAAHSPTAMAAAGTPVTR